MRLNRVVLPQSVVSRTPSVDEHTHPTRCVIQAIRWLVLAMVMGLVGCQQSDPIREYTVAKPPAPRKAPLPERAARGPEISKPPTRTDPTTDRILGAILPQGEITWFVKLQGPVKSSREAVEPFLRFVRSFDFPEVTPVWKLPESWKEVKNPEGKGRFATLEVPIGNETLEVTVTELKSPGSDPDSYLLANINRWRNQLHQPPYGPDQLEQATIAVKTDAGHTAWLVNIEGWLPGSAPAAVAAPRLPFEYQVPNHWQVGGLRAFQRAAWNVSEEGRKATVTISTAGGDLVGNIQRWRDQVGLPRIDSEEVHKSMQTLNMGKAIGKYVVLQGPEGNKAPQSILGVIVSAVDEQWFFKMQGDAPLVAGEQANFEAFVRSVQFP